MATNPLYLNTPPSTEKEHDVKLTLVNSKGQSDSNVSLNELMSQMCAMIQLLHLVEGELAMNQTKMASLDNSAAQVNIDAVTAEGKQAVEKTKEAIAAEERPWWEKLLIAVFSVVMVALSYFTMGLTAAVLAAVIIVITTVPLPFLGGKTLVGWIASKIAEKIGKDNHWSQAKIQEVTGYLNLALGVLLAVASLGIGSLGASAEMATTAVTVVEEGAELSTMLANDASSLVEDVASAGEGAVSTTSKAMNIGKFSAVNAFVSQVANSNCIGDIMIGTMLSANPNATDKEKEAFAGIAAALDILVAVFGALVGGKIAISSIGQDLAEGSTFISKLGDLAPKLICTVETANGLGQGGMNIYQGIIDINVGELNAAVTRLQGGMENSKELTALIGLTMNQINAMMKDFADEYKSLESNLKSIGLYDSSEVNALLKANQQS